MQRANTASECHGPLQDTSSRGEHGVLAPDRAALGTSSTQEEELGVAETCRPYSSHCLLPGKPRDVSTGELQTPAPRVGGHSPEMRLAMVLVGTNRVCSTPSSFAAFSCSSEKREGRAGPECLSTIAQSRCALVQFNVQPILGVMAYPSLEHSAEVDSGLRAA